MQATTSQGCCRDSHSPCELFHAVKAWFSFLGQFFPSPLKEMVCIKSSSSAFLWGLGGEKVCSCSGGWIGDGEVSFLLGVEVLSGTELSET